jgi:hypothetical protein
MLPLPTTLLRLLTESPRRVLPVYDTPPELVTAERRRALRAVGSRLLRARAGDASRARCPSCFEASPVTEAAGVDR